MMHALGDLAPLFAAVARGDATVFDAATVAACSPAQLQDLIADAHAAGHGSLARQLRQVLPPPVGTSVWAFWLEWAVRGNQPAEVAQLLEEAAPGPAWAVGALTQALRLERSECVDLLLPQVEPKYLLHAPYLQAIAHGDQAAMARLEERAGPTHTLAARASVAPLLAAVRQGQVAIALERLPDVPDIELNRVLSSAIQGQRAVLIEALLPLAPLGQVEVYADALPFPSVFQALVTQKRLGKTLHLHRLVEDLLENTTSMDPRALPAESWVTLIRTAGENPHQLPGSVLERPHLAHLILPTLMWAHEQQPNREAGLNLATVARLQHTPAFEFLASLSNQAANWPEEVFWQALRHGFADQVDQRLATQDMGRWDTETWEALEPLLLAQPKDRQVRWLAQVYPAYVRHAQAHRRPLDSGWVALDRERTLAQQTAPTAVRTLAQQTAPTAVRPRSRPRA